MKEERIYSLDFLKFIATLCIMFHHYQIYTKTQFPTGVNFVGGRFEFSFLVELFFVLSGYFISSYIENIKEGMSFQDFFVPKYLRFLLPSTITVIVFAVLDILYEQLYSEQFFDRTVQIWGVLATSLGFSNGWGIPNSKMNGTLWYISVLLICYMIFYVIVFVSKKLNASPYWMFAFMIFLSFSVATNQINFLFLDFGTSRGLSSFFWGVILARFMRGKKMSAKAAAISLFALVGTAIVILRYNTTYASDGQRYLYTFCMYPLLLAVLQTTTMKRLFKSKLWGWLGNVSFEAYIWHFPLILALLNIDKIWNLNIDYTNRINLLVIAAASFVVGIPCYYLVEKPASSYFAKRLAGIREENTSDGVKIRGGGINF